MDAQFIDINYLRKQTAIAGNVDATELLPFIAEAQSMYIQELIGTKLYEELIEAVYNSTLGSPVIPLTTDQINLLNKIQPSLAYYTMYVGMPFTMVKWKNKGLQKNSSNDTGGTFPELREMQYLRENVLNTAKFYADRITKFLCNYSELYPSYTNQGQNADIYPKSAGSMGFYTGNSNGLSDAEKQYLKSFIG